MAVPKTAALPLGYAPKLHPPKPDNRLPETDRAGLRKRVVTRRGQPHEPAPAQHTWITEPAQQGGVRSLKAHWIAQPELSSPGGDVPHPVLGVPMIEKLQGASLRGTGSSASDVKERREEAFASF